MISNILKYHAAKGPKKWVLWLVVSIAALIAIVALYIRMNRRQQLITKLRNDADSASQKAEQLRFKIVHEQDAVKLNEMVAQAQVLQDTANAKRAEIAKNAKEFAAEYKQVKALESWKDLDAYNQKSRS
jgi:hypothetical protein